jgi:hypothetical protein
MASRQQSLLQAFRRRAQNCRLAVAITSGASAAASRMLQSPFATERGKVDQNAGQEEAIAKAKGATAKHQQVASSRLALRRRDRERRVPSPRVKTPKCAARTLPRPRKTPPRHPRRTSRKRVQNKKADAEARGEAKESTGKSTAKAGQARARSDAKQRKLRPRLKSPNPSQRYIGWGRG